MCVCACPEANLYTVAEYIIELIAPRIKAIPLQCTRPNNVLRENKALSLADVTPPKCEAFQVTWESHGVFSVRMTIADDNRLGLATSRRLAAKNCAIRSRGDGPARLGIILEPDDVAMRGASRRVGRRASSIASADGGRGTFSRGQLPNLKGIALRRRLSRYRANIFPV